MKEWTSEEIDLLFTPMSNKEIQRITGRSIDGILRKRYRMTGHTVEEDNWRDEYDTADEKAIKEYHALRNEEHLKRMCRSLGVRLGGM